MQPPSSGLLRALRQAAYLPLNAPRHTTRFQLSSRGSPNFKLSPRMISATSQCSQSPDAPPRHTSRIGTRTPNPRAPTSRDRGPTSKEDTQTDFGKMDILANMGTPATSVDACTTDGFHLNNGVKTAGGHGIILIGGEAFQWSPWKVLGNSASSPSAMLSKVGVMTVPNQGFGLLDLIYPKPDLLIVGTGSRLWMLSKDTKQFLSSIGIKVDVMDTANAAAAYNLLATERGVDEVAAAFFPIGWKGKL